MTCTEEFTFLSQFAGCRYDLSQKKLWLNVCEIFGDDLNQYPE